MEESVGSLMDKIRKNLYVCFDRECERRDLCSSCLSFDEFVPDDCGYAIFHPLETTQAEIAQRGRRTGKTTRLMAIAKKIADAGCKVYYVMPTLDMVDVVRWQFGPIRDIQFFSMAQIKKLRARGFAPGYVIADEIPESELGFIELELVGSRIVAAYWT